MAPKNQPNPKRFQRPAAKPRSPFRRPAPGHDAQRPRSLPHEVRPALLQLGTQALAEALTFATPADMVLRRFFREHPQLGRRDRGVIAEAVFAVLRRLSTFTQLAAGRDPRRLFLLGVRQRGAGDEPLLEPMVSAEERSWLDQAERIDTDTLPLAARAELPEWVVELLSRAFSDEQILALGRGMQSAAPLDLRVNALSCTREEAINALEETGISAQATRYSPVGVRVRGKPALEQHALYLSGRIEVQDEGSQLLGFLLAPRRREMVVDFCAGAGGKTLLLGAMMRSEGRLYAFDVSSQRIHRLRARVARSGLSNVQPEVVAHEHDTRLKRLAGKIDRVLVDAPCTGFGTLRRNPDLKWRQQPADLSALQEKQTRILEAAAKLIKPGGRLVYATCSFLPAENDAIVDAFLSAHPQFRELDCTELLARQDIMIDCGTRLRLLPHRHGTDGFFAAAFERIQEEDSAAPGKPRGGGIRD
jgi:16S rRNA (cytosine967-C5)-methyltransferase